ncbi:MAG: site-2 protease family protein [Magnetococcales bacterium]|nr:site-2 protease family protein [Magnetococcales bacterium]
MISVGDILIGILTWGPGILFAITLHEWAHGYVATRFGDPTPGMMGRLTLNPIPHIDPVWTIMVPAVMLVTSLIALGKPFVFGGAKPVPINPRNFKPSHYRLAMFSVSVAGPLMNLFLALICAFSLQGALLLPEFMVEPAIKVLLAALQMNVLLAVFNMLPILPLDGGRVLAALLPPALAYKMAALERYGLPIVVILSFSGLLGKILLPAMSYLMFFYMQLAGVM